MEINGGIDPDVPLDYVELQIFPSQNRYEAYVCSSNKAAKSASGTLKQLLLHSPQVKDLSSKGSNMNFKILPPDNANDAKWFTSATLKRFIRVLSSPDILSIGNEITQLEETRKFQLSLSLKSVVDITSSIDSKNELLRAVDLRLSELKEEVVTAFDQITSTRCSIKDISDLESFAHHFGAKNIRDLLQKFVEMNLFPTVEDSKKSKTKTENEISSFSSDDDQPSVDRCRASKRSATPRRSASPMRRVQIGRSGSHRAPALTIKSLNHFPLREKILFQRCPAGNSSDEDEDDDDPDKSSKKNVMRMSVQDKISLFESKQRDQKVDVIKNKRLLSTSFGRNKAVLRRWSAGMGEHAAQKPENFLLSPNNTGPGPEPIPGPEPEPESNWVSIEAVENIKPQSPENEENCEKHEDSIEWSEQNEAKLNELLMKMMENKNKPVRHHNTNSDITKGKKSTVLKEDRGEKSCDQNKIRVEASGKKPEKKSERSQKLTPLMNSRKEPLKPSVIKKPATKPSSLPATRKSWSSSPSPKTSTVPVSDGNTPNSRKQPIGSNPNKTGEKSQPRSKTPKSTDSTPPDANRNLKNVMNTRSTVTKSRKTAEIKVQTPEVKPSFYNKVINKSSVVPLETKPFLRKGSGIGPGVGPVFIKSKVVDQPEEASRNHNEVVMANDVSENEEKCYVISPSPIPSLSPSPIPSRSPSPNPSPSPSPIPSPSPVESMSCNVELTEVINENKEVEDELDNNNEEEEMIPSLVQTESPVQVVVPAGSSSSPRVRHSLSEMLLEESNLEERNEDADVSEWGNAEHPPSFIYQKDSPKGFKRLLKFARKSKAESALLDADNEAGEFKVTSQNQLKALDGNVSVSLNTMKGSKSFFSLSAFRVSKTHESKLP